MTQLESFLNALLMKYFLCFKTESQMLRFNVKHGLIKKTSRIFASQSVEQIRQVKIIEGNTSRRNKVRI